jgi:hypothetical protein
MSPQDHEAVMQAEDPYGPPENGGAQEARSAVARTFASIMQARHPGSTWLPVEATDGNAPTRTGKLVHVLPTPDDPGAISDLLRTAAGTPDVDDIDSSGEQALALSSA